MKKEWPCQLLKDTFIGVDDLGGDGVDISYRHGTMGTSVFLGNDEAYEFAQAVAAACRRDQLAANGPCCACRLIEGKKVTP